MNQIENNDELFEHFSLLADKGQEPIRVDKFLMNRIENATRNKIQKAAKSGYIFSNENPVKQNYKVKPGRLIFFPSYLPHQYIVDMGYEPFRFIHWNCQAIPKGVLNVV